MKNKILVVLAITFSVVIFAFFPINKSVAQTIEPIIDSANSTSQDSNLTNPSTDITTSTTSTKSQISFDIEIFIETQNPWNNKIPITIRFIPSTDVKETDVSIIAPFGLEIDPRYKNFFPTKAGEVYEVKAFIIPVNSGSYDIAVDITAWTADSNYTSSKKFNITLDDNLIITPTQPGYAGAQILKFGAILLAFAISVVGMIFLAKFGIKKLKNWLKPPVYK
ncbi:MAG TPA: hypothetical protein PKJ86_00295 [Candidatus Dojkabacteria bacterium]|nr:hypothetical protein [Candidatus Dojkabacteria bacterium]